MAASQEIVDLGVDWLTVTGNTKSSRKKLELFGMRLMEEEHDYGNERKPWSFKGYDGFRSGGVEVGTRYDSSIVRITGGLAREHYLEAYHTATNCSRVDFQVTVNNGIEPQQWITSQFKRAYAWSMNFKRKPHVDLLWSNNGTATLYLNQRISDQFGRLYDKGEESLNPVLEDCWRAEVEYKGDQAFHQLKHLCSSSSPGDYISANLQRFFRKRTCQLRLKPTNTQTFVLHRRPTDQDRQLEWIRKCVGPTIRRLMDSGRTQEVLDCLALPELTARHVRRHKIAVTS